MVIVLEWCVGRNGDGKSTLLIYSRVLVKPDEGRVVRTGGVRFCFFEAR